MVIMGNSEVEGWTVTIMGIRCKGKYQKIMDKGVGQ